MVEPNRRLFLGGLAIGAGGLAAARSLASDLRDGHASGIDVAPSSTYLPLIARRTGDPVIFTASLDKAALKATSGGWAREITARTLPLATGIAGAHLFMNPGGSREIHWHSSAEWAYVIAGACQVSIVDPDGTLEVVNYGPGDAWYFPSGHPHGIQTLGTEPCHAFLAFDDGLYSEHGTFGISDWLSRLDPAALEQGLGLPADTIANLPRGETYIKQGDVIPLDGPEARAARPLGPERTHRFRLALQTPSIDLPGGSVRVASSREFPASATMTGLLIRLQPGAMQELHWHPEANEWHYLLRGRVRMTLFAPDKRLAIAELGPGDCAYIPRACGHMTENIGSDESELITVMDNPRFETGSLADLIAKAPSHLLANNLGTSPGQKPSARARQPIIERQA